MPVKRKIVANTGIESFCTSVNCEYNSTITYLFLLLYIYVMCTLPIRILWRIPSAHPHWHKWKMSNYKLHKQVLKEQLTTTVPTPMFTESANIRIMSNGTSVQLAKRYGPNGLLAKYDLQQALLKSACTYL